jgi:hypothetical protein
LEIDEFVTYPVAPIEYADLMLDKDEFETNEYLIQLDAKDKAMSQTESKQHFKNGGLKLKSVTAIKNSSNSKV